MEQFFDLQVNGYGGVDFNKEALTPEELHRACKKLESDGVEGILATVVTDNIDVMARRLSRIVELREKDPLAAKLVKGFHIEGPFINELPGYRGAHPVDAIHPAREDEMKQLLEAAGGLTRVVTLAPERDFQLKVTRMLHGEKICVSAGHCNPTLDQLCEGIDSGLSMFTHLGNGCPMEMHRHDNIIQRALSLAKNLWLCFIADGAHIAFHALGNYLRAAGIERCIVVTDAIAPAGMGPGNYTLSRWNLTIGTDMVARAPDGSHLVGSAITMPESCRNLQKHCGLSPEEIHLLTATNPRRAIMI